MLASLKQLLSHAWANVNDINYVFYACPQLTKDVDSEPFGVCAFGSEGIKEECSSDYSKCFKNEGIFAFNL